MMEDDSDQSDSNSEEIAGLGSTSPPDSDSLDNPYRLETIKLLEIFFFRDEAIMLITM